MDVAQYLARRTTPNPLHPYTWTAHYRDGASLRQFDAWGYHRGAEIDVGRVERLVLEGHPSGPLVIPRPGGVVDAVVLQADETIRMGAGGRGAPGASVTIWAGFRVAAILHGLRLEDTGRVTAGPWPWHRTP